MDSLPPPPAPWRPLLAATVVLLGMASVVLWNWQVLEQRETRESERRFALDVQTLGQALQARMQAYEIVLRGIASPFSTGRAPVSQAQWEEAMARLELQGVYPGISSLSWSRRVRQADLAAFLARVRADNRPGFTIFPAGERTEYQILEHIAPLTTRTMRVVGMDILTQTPQKDAINQAIDEGRATLSLVMPDLYPVSPEPVERAGALMYFPVFAGGGIPDTPKQRRAFLIGMTNIAFRGQELVEGVFGTQLSLFHIRAYESPSGALLFDSHPKNGIPRDWVPLFHQQLELPLYGHIWRLDITGTPEYEKGLASGRGHAFTLTLGLLVSLIMASLTAGFLRQRDRQMHAREMVAARLHEQAEQLILANRYKSEFLANMSHELRTPLNSILILSDQLRQNTAGNLNEKQMRHADIVYRAGSDLLQLINDVLDLAKIEAGRVQVNLEPLNLRDVLIDLDAAMRPQAEAKGLILHITPIAEDNGVPQWVHTDRVRLHQILRNLLSNAIKFTDSGEVELRIRAQKTLADGRVLVRFDVVDSGIGIDPTQHEQVFEAFAQLDGSTRRRFGGTGLGLPITRQLVEMLEGRIKIRSALGKGSTFTVYLPMQGVEHPQQLPAEQAQRGGDGPTLLIVEDDAHFASIITEQAHIHGFSSIHCSTGQQALALLRSETFAAIILDIVLPDISGWQLYRRLRSQAQHHHMPVHIISCLPQPAGVLEEDTHYLTKPVGRDTLEQLFDSLRNAALVAQPTASNRAPALLLVEDEETEREHYQERLHAMGFAVTAVANSEQARTAWTGGSFDVLVIDLNLPDQDGFTLLDSLQRLRPLRGTRVVVNTGVDVTCQGLQRLHRYSATVVHKSGADTTMLSRAVQGFLGHVKTLPQRHNGSSGNSQSHPAAPVAEPAALPAPQPPAAPEALADLRGKRLLLVDDDIRNVYAMSALLDEFGLTISTASNGQEAIERYQNEPLDVILMDMSMPVMDGYTACGLLKNEHHCTIPVIALTAHAMKGDREKCLAAGADDYMAKPVQREALRALLEQWLHQETE